MNRVDLIGRLGQDPEYIQNDKIQVVKFSVATNETWKDKQGQKQERTTWHDVKAFGRVSEAINQWFKKGDVIRVEGKIQTESWENKEGEKRSKQVIHLKEFGFISKMNDQSSTPEQKTEPTKASPVVGGDDVDRLPF